MKAFILDRYGSADHVRAGDGPDRSCARMTSYIIRVASKIHLSGANQ